MGFVDNRNSGLWVSSRSTKRLSGSTLLNPSAERTVYRVTRPISDCGTRRRLRRTSVPAYDGAIDGVEQIDPAVLAAGCKATPRRPWSRHPLTSSEMSKRAPCHGCHRSQPTKFCPSVSRHVDRSNQRSPPPTGPSQWHPLLVEPGGRSPEGPSAPSRAWAELPKNSKQTPRRRA